MDVLELRRWQSHHDGPDEATEFARNSRNGNVPMFSLIQSEEFLGKSMLCFQGNRYDFGRLSLTPAVEDECSASRMVVVPNSLNEQSPDVRVTSFGDGTSEFPRAG